MGTEERTLTAHSILAIQILMHINIQLVERT